MDGIKQAPIEGTSFAYTFDKENAKEPSRHKIQYFEMMGQWALYNEGWLLSTKVNRAPWEAFERRQCRTRSTTRCFELYDLNTRASANPRDIAAQDPDKVKEMKKPSSSKKRRSTRCFPLDASVAARIVAPARPNITRRPQRSSFTPIRWSVMPQGDSPDTCSTAPTPSPPTLTVPEGGAPRG